jgi:excisionase family DNA binding protein
LAAITEKWIERAEKRGYKEGAGFAGLFPVFRPFIQESGRLFPMAQVQMAPREVMDIRQASEYLGISGDTLYRYASEGFIPAFKLGNRWRFKKTLLDAWMDEKSGVKLQTPVEVAPKQKKPVGRAR